MDRPTGLAGESSPKPPSAKDWRPALEQKVQGMLYSFGASSTLGRNSNAAKMGEAYRDCSIVSQDGNNSAQIGQGYYMKAMSPGADFDASSIEEARKKRVEALQHIIGRGRKVEPVAQEDRAAGTRPTEESERKSLVELSLLRNYVAPRRATLRTIQTVDSMENLAQPADPSQLLRATEEVHPNSPRLGSPHVVAHIAAASALAEQRKHSPRQDGVYGWGTGDSKASTERSASNAAIWRSQSKYDDSVKEKEKPKQRSRGRRSLTPSTGTLGELEEWWKASSPGPEEKSGRRDSALAGLEETQRGGAGDKGKAKSPAADRSSAPSSSPGPVPVPDGRRRRPTKKRTPRQRTARWIFLHEEPVSESAVLEPARYPRRLTAAEKGKWRAECECPKCQPLRDRRVRFDDSAMEKAEDGPGLSHEGFVKMMRENRRRLEAQQRGEGASSWAADGTTGGMVGLDMFKNPRPAPRVPVRWQESGNVMQGERVQKRRVNKQEIGEPMGRAVVSPRVHGFPSPDPRSRSRAMQPGEPDPMAAVQTDGRSHQKVWRALSRRFKK